jgi:hypothetical protein
MVVVKFFGTKFVDDVSIFPLSWSHLQVDRISHNLLTGISDHITTQNPNISVYTGYLRSATRIDAYVRVMCGYKPL